MVGYLQNLPLVEALWSRTESSEFRLAHLPRLDTWVSANISPALFRCYALALAAGSPGGQRGQMVHPVHQGQACRVPGLAGAAWYLLCSKSSTVGTASVVLSITPKDLVINLLVDEESLVVNVVGEVEDQLDEEYLVVNVLGEVEVEVPSRQCSSVSSQFEFEYDFNLIWVPNLMLNMILIWFEIPIWSWIWFQFDLSSQLEVEYYFNLIEFEHDPTWLNLNDKFFSPSPRWFSSDYSHFAT